MTDSPSRIDPSPNDQRYRALESGSPLSPHAFPEKVTATPVMESFGASIPAVIFASSSATDPKELVPLVPVVEVFEFEFSVLVLAVSGADALDALATPGVGVAEIHELP